MAAGAAAARCLAAMAAALCAAAAGAQEAAGAPDAAAAAVSSMTSTVSTSRSVVSGKPRTVTLPDGTVVTMETTTETVTRSKVDVKAAVPEKPRRRRTAIFVTNNTEKRFDAALARIRSELAAQITGGELEVMDYREVVAAIAPLQEGMQTADGIGQTDRTETLYAKIGAMFGQATGKSADGRNATQDEKLLANTSFTRLAGNMGADYVLMVSLDRFSKSRRTLRSKHLDGPVVNELYTITSSYKALDAYSGQALGGGTLRTKKAVRQTEGARVEFDDYADGLEEELVEQMAGEILEKAPGWREASIRASGVPVTFVATAYDMNNKPIYLPRYGGKADILFDRAPASLAATVEIDGVARGATQCTVPVGPGMHKVRFLRPGYDSVALTISPKSEMTMSVSLRMSEAEYARVKDSIAFFHRLTVERDLSQAQVKRLEGEAKLLEKSGIRIDAKEIPTIQQKSLF